MSKLTPRRLAAITLAGAGALAFLGTTIGAVLYLRKHGWTGQQGFQLEQPPRFEWRSVEKKHWSTYLECWAAIIAYCIIGLPRTGCVFFPGKPILPARPSSNAATIKTPP